MLFFVISLAVGIAAVLLAQKADIECARTPNFQDPVLRSLAFKPAAKRQVEWARHVPLAQLAQQ